jgi:chromatin remodeling complex protein RSC6
LPKEISSALEIVPGLSAEIRQGRSREPPFAWQPSPARSNCPMPTPKKAAAPKNALSKPVQPDAALAAVVVKDPLPRTELTKKLWEYIRKHEPGSQG